MREKVDEKKIKEVGGVTGHLERNRHRGLLLPSPFSLQGEKKFVDFEEERERGGTSILFPLLVPFLAYLAQS